MNNEQTAKIIKNTCKIKKISVTTLLDECNIRKSLIYDLEKRDYTPSAAVVEKIADYLDCSVDYLLGRTDNINYTTNSYNHNGDNSVQNIGGQTSSTDSVTREMIERFEILDFSKKIKVMTLIDELVNEKK